jgi:MFS family permease
MLFAIAALTSAEQFEQFGWRIPFLLSILLVVVGVYLRYRVGETPAFEALVKHREEQAESPQAPPPPSRSLKRHRGTIIRLLLFWAAPASCFWVVNIYSISYLTTHTSLSRETVFACVMVANAVSIATTIIGGASTDRFGRKPPLIITSIIMLAISACYFPILDTGSIPLIIMAMALFAGSIQAQSGILPAYFAEQFPTSARYAGSALAYTGANLLFAGPTPFVAAWIAERSGGSSTGLTAMCVGLVTMSFIALLKSPETRHVDLAAFEDDEAQGPVPHR